MPILLTTIDSPFVVITVTSLATFLAVASASGVVAAMYLVLSFPPFIFFVIGGNADALLAAATFLNLMLSSSAYVALTIIRLPPSTAVSVLVVTKLPVVVIVALGFSFSFAVVMLALQALVVFSVFQFLDVRSALLVSSSSATVTIFGSTPDFTDIAMLLLVVYLATIAVVVSSTFDSMLFVFVVFVVIFSLPVNFVQLVKLGITAMSDLFDLVTSIGTYVLPILVFLVPVHFVRSGASSGFLLLTVRRMEKHAIRHDREADAQVA